MEKLGIKAIWREFKAYIIIAIGLLSYCLGWDIFLIPNHMVGGGVTGISAILLYAFGIPVSISFFIINTVLLAIALKVLGKSFGFKTVFATVVVSLYFQFLPQYIPTDFIVEFATSNGKLVCAICGGALAGVGIGICFSVGGSTGGTDIVALIITKYRNVSPGRVILLIDIFIIASSLFLPAQSVSDAGGAAVEVTLGQRLATIMYGYILVGVCSFSIDFYMSGTNQNLQLFIFSKEYDRIADAITQNLGRGVTVFDGQGWYTKRENKVLLVVVHKQDLNFVYRFIKDVDPKAFVSVASVHGVYGEGFEEMKK